MSLCKALVIRQILNLNSLDRFPKKKRSNITFHINPSNVSTVFPCGRTNGHTDMTELIVTFRNVCERAEKG